MGDLGLGWFAASLISAAVSMLVMLIGWGIGCLRGVRPFDWGEMNEEAAPEELT